MGKVIRLKPNIITFDSDDTGRKTDMPGHEPSISTSGEHTPKGYIPTEDLYPVRDRFNSALSSAFQLLRESLDHINESVRMLDEDLMSSDDALQKFQALLPELFCCRDLGDGFGAIISSIYHAINNMTGTPLNESQLIAIRNILKRIHSEPFIGYEEAVEEIMLLESAGFEVALPHFKFVADLLNE